MRGVRVQTTFSSDAIKTIDNYAKMAGMTRSAFITNAVGEKLLQLKLVQDVSGKVLAEENQK